MESLSALKPVFPDWGPASTTAGNASGIGDGAALCILTTRARAQQEGMEIVGKWVGSAIVGASDQILCVVEVILIIRDRRRTKIHGGWSSSSHPEGPGTIWPF